LCRGFFVANSMQQSHYSVFTSVANYFKVFFLLLTIVIISGNHFVVIDFIQNHPDNQRLEFTGAEVIDATLVFVKMPD
jgi:hypothetical protein